MLYLQSLFELPNVLETIEFTNITRRRVSFEDSESVVIHKEGSVYPPGRVAKGGIDSGIGVSREVPFCFHSIEAFKECSIPMKTPEECPISIKTSNESPTPINTHTEHSPHNTITLHNTNKISPLSYLLYLITYFPNGSPTRFHTQSACRFD